jgi:hypothetical protein
MRVKRAVNPFAPLLFASHGRYASTTTSVGSNSCIEIGIGYCSKSEITDWPQSNSFRNEPWERAQTNAWDIPRNNSTVQINALTRPL